MARTFVGTEALTVPGVDLIADWTVAGWFRRSHNGQANDEYLYLRNASGVTSAPDQLSVYVQGTTNASSTGDHIRVDVPFVTQILISNQRILDSAWHHYAATKLGTLWTLYIDGILEVSATNVQAQDSTTAIAQIFSNNCDLTTGSSWVGDGGETATWNTALTAGEVRLLSRGKPANTVRPGFLTMYLSLAAGPIFDEVNHNLATVTGLVTPVVQKFAPPRPSRRLTLVSITASNAGVGSSAGTSTVNGVGASIVAGIASAAGQGTATGVGASTNAATASTAGIGAASGVGASTATSIGSAAGTSTVSGAGVTLKTTTASAAGIGAASGVGASTAASTASASGTGAASGVGVSINAATASAAGVGAASGVGTSTAASTASAAGTSSVSGVGVAVSTSTASAAGTSSVSGVGVAVNASTASAAGTSSVSGVGVAIAASTGSAAGTGAASAVGSSFNPAVGTSAGTSTAAGVSVTNIGSSAGTSTVLGVGLAVTAAVGTASGSSTANGSTISNNTTGTCAGTSTALAVGSNLKSAVGTCAGHSTTNAQWTLAQPIATPTATIFLTTASAVQTSFNANPGATFSLAAGTYRITSGYSCSDNMRIIGDPAGGTIINGALLLTGWTLVSGFWQKTGMVAQSAADPGGFSDGTYAFTLQTQDLFVNNVFYPRASTKAAVAAGTWFWDTAANIAYMKDNPTGQTVELNSSANCLQNGVNVQCFNLTFSHCANNASAAVNPGDLGWCMILCSALYNHGGGLAVGDSSVIWGCKANDNGQQGMLAGSCQNAKVWVNEIARNNYAHYDYEWEAGGFKFVQSDNVSVRNNNVHDNHGVGIWGDIDNSNWFIDNNLVTGNYAAGIMYEISWGATVISRNVCAYNGLVSTGYTRSGILIQNSQGVTVTGNTLVVDPVFGNAVTLTDEDRGTSTATGHVGVAYRSKNNTISSNDVTFMGTGGGQGFNESFDTVSGATSNNQFVGNHYHVTDLIQVRFRYNSGVNGYSFATFQAFGQEAGGTIDLLVPHVGSAAGTSTAIAGGASMRAAPATAHGTGTATGLGVLVQALTSGQYTGANVTTMSQAFANPVGIRDHVIVGVAYDSTSSLITGVTDDKLNVYNFAFQLFDVASNQNFAVYYCPTIVNAPSIISASFNNPLSNIEMILNEFRTLGSLDMVAGNLNNSGLTTTDGVVSGSTTTTTDGDTIIVLTNQLTAAALPAPGTGFNDTLAGGTFCASEYKLQNTAGSINGTYTASVSADQLTILLAFRPFSSVTSGVASAAGFGTAVGVGRSTRASVGTAAGTSTAQGITTKSGTGTCIGTSATNGVGASTGAGAGSSAGISVATAIGARTVAVTATAAGTSTAIAASSAIINTVGSAAGTSTTIAQPAVIGTAIGHSTTNGIGASTNAANASAAGTSDAQAVGQTIDPTVGTAAGTSVTSGVGNTVLVSAGTCAGTSDAAGVGNPIVAGTATAIGHSTTNGVGSSGNVSTASAAGTSTAQAIGGATNAAVASAAGIADAEAIGAGTANSVGTAAGTSVTSGNGLATVNSVGTAAGTSTCFANNTASGTATSSSTAVVSGVGASIAASIASAAGTSDGTVVGGSTNAAIASATGIASALAIGVSTASVPGTCAGTSTCIASGAGAATSVGSAAGTSTCVANATASGTASSTSVSSCNGVGISINAAAGSCAGIAIASGAGGALAASIASAAGNGAASGVGASSGAGIGLSAGIGDAEAAGASVAASIGAASGSSTTSAVGSSLVAETATAAGTSSANALSITYHVGTGAMAGASQANGVASAVAISIASATGQGQASGIARTFNNTQATASGVCTVVGISGVSFNPTSVIVDHHDIEASLHAFPTKPSSAGTTALPNTAPSTAAVAASLGAIKKPGYPLDASLAPLEAKGENEP